MQIRTAHNVRNIFALKGTITPEAFKPQGLLFQLVKDKLIEGKEAPKTSNATPKCMWILERGALRSKSKRLAQQGILENITFGTGDPSPTFLIGCIFCVLTVWGFFDTLRAKNGCSSPFDFVLASRAQVVYTIIIMENGVGIWILRFWL